jgi:hypothetical protein
MISALKARPRIALATVLMGAAIASVAALVLISPKSALALDPRAAACGALVRAPIKAQVALSKASDYHAAFPKMGYSPELEQAGAAFAVVYDGDATVIGVTGAPAAQDKDGNTIAAPPVAQSTYSGVVCVATDNGPVVYVNVDTGP